MGQIELPISLIGVKGSYLEFIKTNFGYLIKLEFNSKNDNYGLLDFEAEWFEKELELCVWSINSDKKVKKFIINLIKFLENYFKIKTLTFGNISNKKTIRLIENALNNQNSTKYLNQFNWKFGRNFMESPFLKNLNTLGYKKITIKMLMANQNAKTRIDKISGEISNNLSFEISR